MRWTHFFVAASVLVLDQILKFYIRSNIPYLDLSIPYPYDGIAVFQNFFGIDFSINHVTNQGAAWGMFSSFPHALLILRIFFVAVLTVYCAMSKKLIPIQRYAFSLICAGALGNILDFWTNGRVVDMFLFKFGTYIYPLFNIADSAIFCGVALLLLESFFFKSAQKRERANV